MSNEQKTPLARTLPLLVDRRIRDALDLRGKKLPGRVHAVSGAIVTVSFDLSGLLLPLVKMPLAGSEYVRLPIQPGDLGFCTTADRYLGGVSGLGQATAADNVQQGNLSALVWEPLGNVNWSAVDPDAVTIYGPNGVVFRDTAGHTVATLTPSGLVITAQTDFQVTVAGGPQISMSASQISLQVGGKGVVITSSGTTVDGKPFLAHEHLPGTYVAPSGGGPVTGDSGAVV